MVLSIVFATQVISLKERVIYQNGVLRIQNTILYSGFIYATMYIAALYESDIFQYVVVLGFVISNKKRELVSIEYSTK